MNTNSMALRKSIEMRCQVADADYDHVFYAGTRLLRAMN
jgi:hypothetical protein